MERSCKKKPKLIIKYYKACIQEIKMFQSEITLNWSKFSLNTIIIIKTCTINKIKLELKLNIYRVTKSNNNN